MSGFLFRGSGLIRLMKTPDEFTGPVNIGNPEEISIKDLAHLILKLTRSKSKLLFGPLPENDPARRKPDIQLAKKELGWEPTVGLEAGLKNTIDYFLKTISGYITNV